MSSFGEEIRRERELREISLREVSQATKINVRYLEALEGNNFEHLPGGVFNRGFVKAYSEFIGVDPEAMVNAYLLEEQAQTGHGTARDRNLLRRRANPAGERPTRIAAGETTRPAMRWWIWAILAAVVLGGLIWWGLSLRDGDTNATAGVARWGWPDG